MSQFITGSASRTVVQKQHLRGLFCKWDRATKQTWEGVSTKSPAFVTAHHRSLGKILMKRIMLMKMKETRMSISHSSQLMDFLVCCSNRSDSVFNFSRFMSAWRID